MIGLHGGVCEPPAQRRHVVSSKNHREDDAAHVHGEDEGGAQGDGGGLPRPAAVLQRHYEAEDDAEDVDGAALPDDVDVDGAHPAREAQVDQAACHTVAGLQAAEAHHRRAGPRRQILRPQAGRRLEHEIERREHGRVHREVPGAVAAAVHGEEWWAGAIEGLPSPSGPPLPASTVASSSLHHGIPCRTSNWIRGNWFKRPFRRLWSAESAGWALVFTAEEPALLASPEGDRATAGALELHNLLLGRYLSSAANARSHTVTTP